MYHHLFNCEPGTDWCDFADASVTWILYDLLVAFLLLFGPCPVLMWFVDWVRDDVDLLTCAFSCSQSLVLH